MTDYEKSLVQKGINSLAKKLRGKISAAILLGAFEESSAELDFFPLSSNVVAFSTGNGACQVREND